MLQLKALGLAGKLAIAGVVALAIAGAWLYVDRLRDQAGDYADCLAIAGVSRREPARPPRCAASVVKVLEAGKASAWCDEGLAKGDAGVLAVHQACTAPVKRVVAERDARAFEVQDRDRTIDRMTRERSAELARAEARGLAQAQRSEHANRVLQSAPRDDRGRVRCDADCLSVLAGDVPGPRP